MPRRKDKNQFDLFGSDDDKGNKRKAENATVRPAHVPDPLRSLAETLPKGLYLGTSSWSFPGWAGIVYADRASESRLAKEGLAAYAQHPLLRAVGIDRTYYAPLPSQAFAQYAASVPDEFRFLVKAHQHCTMPYIQTRGAGGKREKNNRFLDAAYASDAVVAPSVDGLGEKAGPVLFQFSPINLNTLGGPTAFVDSLHRFLAALPKGPLYAVELRNEALLGQPYRNALDDAGACHCFNVHPSMPGTLKQYESIGGIHGSALVVRWMLGHGLRFEQARAKYAPFNRIVAEDRDARNALSTLCIEAVSQRNVPAFMIINNKAEGCAALSAFDLAGVIAERIGRMENQHR